MPQIKHRLARPVRWNGTVYSSEAAALRGERGITANPGGNSRRILRAAIACGEAEYLPVEQVSGPVDEALRIMQAAQDIRSVAARAPADGSLRRRRKALLKELWRYQARYSVSVSEAVKGLL